MSYTLPDMSKTAVIKTGGKQYVVVEGDVIKIEKMKETPEVGGKFTFDEVLMLDDGKVATVGAPTVKGKKVTAEVLEIGRLPKITVIRYRAKSRHFSKNGHKQPYVKVRISEIA